MAAPLKMQSERGGAADYFANGLPSKIRHAAISDPYGNTIPRGRRWAGSEASAPSERMWWPRRRTGVLRRGDKYFLTGSQFFDSLGRRRWNHVRHLYRRKRRLWALRPRNGDLRRDVPKAQNLSCDAWEDRSCDQASVVITNRRVQNNDDRDGWLILQVQKPTKTRPHRRFLSRFVSRGPPFGPCRSWPAAR